MNIINPACSAHAVWTKTDITLYRERTKWPVETYLTEIQYSSTRYAPNIPSGSALFTSTWPDASKSITETTKKRLTEGTSSLIYS